MFTLSKAEAAQESSIALTFSPTEVMGRVDANILRSSFVGLWNEARNQRIDSSAGILLLRERFTG